MILRVAHFVISFLLLCILDVCSVLLPYCAQVGIILVGNKNDLSSTREISYEEGLHLARKMVNAFTIDMWEECIVFDLIIYVNCVMCTENCVLFVLFDSTWLFSS